MGKYFKDVRKEKSWFKRVATKRNGFVFLLVVVAFIILNKYRLNNPIEVGSVVPNFSFRNIDGNSFTLADVNMPIIIVFYKKHQFFSNYMFNSYYKKLLPELKFIQDDSLAYVITIIDGCDTVEKLKVIAKDDHELLTKIGYVSDNSTIASYFGVYSYPHLFILNKDKEVIYNSKLVSADYIRNKLQR